MNAHAKLTDEMIEPGRVSIASVPAVCPVRSRAAVVALAHVSKSYPGGALALDDITLTIPQGQIFGLLGPNGAGKSTLIRILCGVIAPSSGTAFVCGANPVTSPREVKEQLGALFQGSAMESNMLVSEVLSLFSKFYGHPLNPEDLLARMGLTEVRRKQCRTLSGGQRQRLAIARALVGNPRVLILDEPTTGLDVAARRELMEIIRQLRTEGRTVILSTHNIDEAEQICDQVAIMSRGKLFAVDGPQVIIRQYGSNAKLEILLSQPIPRDRLTSLPGISGATEIHSPNANSGCAYLLEGTDAENMFLQLVRVLIEANVLLEGARLIRSGLEGAYLKLTGERISQ